MSVEKGLVKNARVSIVAMHHRFIEVKVVGRSDIHCLPRITFEFKPHHGKFTVCRRQFPLKLAYATTFNGCQGLDLQKTVIDLRTDVFAHGQLYTALSRVHHRDDTRLLFTDLNDRFSIANVVYRDLLL